MPSDPFASDLFGFVRAKAEAFWMAVRTRGAVYPRPSGSAAQGDCKAEGYTDVLVDSSPALRPRRVNSRLSSLTEPRLLAEARDRAAPNEERYLRAETLTPHVYVTPWTLQITGALDQQRLAEALAQLGKRHPAMRTGFTPTPDGQFYRYIDDTAGLKLEHVTAIDADYDAVRRILHERNFRKPDLAPASLTAFVLIDRGDDRWVLGLNHHHSLSDGQSMRIFIEELLALYRGEDLLPPPPPFSTAHDRDWQNTDDYRAAHRWWCERLTSVSDSGALPADRAAPGSSATQSEIALDFAADDIVAIETAAAEIGVTPFSFLYAVCSVALTRMLDSPHVVTAFQSNGRRPFPNHARTIGAFSNAVILAVDVDEAASIRDLATALHVDMRAAIEREIVPYHHVIQATGVHPRIGINWFPRLPEFSVPGLEIAAANVGDRQSDYDLNLRFVRNARALRLLVFFPPLRISGERAAAFAANVSSLAARLARQPNAAISTVQSLRPAKIARSGANPAQRDGGIAAAFMAVAGVEPDRVAIATANGTIDYGTLAARSAAIIAALASSGIGRGARIAIIADRSPSLVAVLLAAGRAGIVFVVLDSAYPQAWLETLIGIARPQALVADGGDPTFALAKLLAAAMALPLVDTATDFSAEMGHLRLDSVDPDQPAYILFTSGTTGVPKAVVVSHRPLVNFVAWQAAQFDICAGDRITMLSGLGHDPLLRDIFTTLSVGATLLIPAQADIFVPGKLRCWFAKSRPNFAHMTPAMGRLLAGPAAGTQPLVGLRRIFWGGDLLPPALLAEIDAIAPGVAHTNFYGATETPQAAGWAEWDGDPDWKHVPIGRGAADAELVIIDRRGVPKGVGEIGEIAVCSALPVLGQLRDAEIVPLAGRIYATGDRGLYRPNGDIVALGRDDDQIKIRGYRVDLSEIAAVLARLPGVGATSVLTSGEGNQRYIIGFAVTERSEAAVRADLAHRLPAHMLPKRIVPLAAIPLLPNGKIDRPALLRLAAQDVEDGVALDNPKNPVEAALIAAWSASTPGRAIDRRTRFLDLEADSLSFVQLYLATEKAIGAVPDDWQFMPISELAGIQRRLPPFLSAVDTSMMVRAIAIFMVVAGHFHLVSYDGGATSALYLVSGVLLGALQLPIAAARKTAQPIFGLVRRLLLPVLAFSLLLLVVRLVSGKDWHWGLVTMTTNFYDYSQIAPNRHGEYHFYLWYVHCALQLLLLTGAAVGLAGRVKRWRFDPFQLSLVLFGVSSIMRFVITAIIVPDYLAVSRTELTVVHYLPTTHWATLMLGMVIATADTAPRKSIAAALVIGYAALTALVFSSLAWIFLSGFGLLLIYTRRLTVPRPLAWLGFTLSGASLFIYLTHFQWAALLRILGLGGSPALSAVVALGGGVLAWAAWQRLVPSKVGKDSTSFV